MIIRNRQIIICLNLNKYIAKIYRKKKEMVQICFIGIASR